MSGIMAIASLYGRPVPPELPRAQLAAIVHRGEWEPRLWEAPGIALGHVNLPRTPQAEHEFLPMSDRTGRYSLTWDGRLDNRDELGPKLGYDVNERAEKTDAEYVLDSFIKWGDDCVHHLLGDWAVVIWDAEARRLFCAKDPLGWRQLYYAEHEGLVAVGSEPQQFFSDWWLGRSPNYQHLLEYLADFERVPNSTCFSGVRNLQGGSILAIQPGKTEVRTFWAAPAAQPRGRDLKEIVEEFEHLFRAALGARLRSNRPLGVFLSGGLDSSYIAALAAERGVFSTVSAFAPETLRFDERPFIEAMRTHCGLESHLLDISDCWPLSQRWVRPEMIDEEHVPVQGAMYAKLADASRKAGLGVMLGGEGADEWIDGDPLAVQALLQGNRSLASAILASRGIRGRRAKGQFLAAELIEACSPKLGRLLSRKGWRSTERDRSHLRWPKRQRLRERCSTVPVWRHRARIAREWIDYRLEVSPAVSWRERHTLTPNGIELRSPFNDLRIVQFMAGIGQTTRRFDGTSKSILRAAERPVVPAEIASRQDFGTMTELVVEPLWRREQARVAAALDSISMLPFVRETAVQRRWASWLTTHDNRDRDLTWRLITCGLWLNGLTSTFGLKPHRESTNTVIGRG